MKQVTPQSRKTFHQLKKSGELGEEQEFVHEKLLKYGPVTGMELHEKLAIVEDNHKSKVLGPERVRKRLPELADLGLVMRMGTKTCGVTGREATEWVAV